MTDPLLQAKDRRLAAQQAYQAASDGLNLAMQQLEIVKKQRAEAQTAFERKTLTYSLAIQTASNLETQPYLSEKALIAANHDLDVSKQEYEAAQSIHQAQEAFSQAAFYRVVESQAVYDAAKIAYDGADYDYDRILRERKLPLLGEVEPSVETELPTENIDFLMQFLNQHPLPDYREKDAITDGPQATDETDPIDAMSLPFEKRPAIEKPPELEALQAQMTQSKSGHITWHFDSPDAPDTANDMENTTDD